MARPQLHSDDKKTVRTASRRQVEATLIHSVRRHIKSDQWLDNTNRYRENAIQQIEKDHRKNKLQTADLKDYIAASCPLHLLDGWSFLGRAFDCLMRGDADSARHLAYYAELRAAMSLLASEGVGVFSKRHFVVDDSGKCLPITQSGPTHEFVWACLKHWSTLDQAANLLDEVVQPRGVPFGDWLGAANLGSTRRVLAQHWLREWGLDLRRFASDREARNEASYRPTRLREREALAPIDTVAFTEGCWRAFEPQAGGRFGNLDLHLLRIGLSHAHRGRGGGGTDLGTRMRWAVEAHGEPPACRDSLHRFLTRATEPDDALLLQEAAKTDSVDHERRHLQVISRATLLLVVATGSARLLLHAGGIDASELSFWWQRLGEERG
ncbi:unnamed protein product, partial [marine sediment metagenome]